MSAKRGVSIAFLIVTIVAVVLLVFAWINSDEYGYDQDYGYPQLALRTSQETIMFSRDEIETIGLHTFTATLDIGNGISEQHVCEGVSLKRLLEYSMVQMTSDATYVAVGEDGHRSAYTAQEVDQEDVYIVIAADGHLLAPPTQGGPGPLMAAVREDRSTQRWCKYLVEIRVE